MNLAFLVISNFFPLNSCIVCETSMYLIMSISNTVSYNSFCKWFELAKDLESILLGRLYATETGIRSGCLGLWLIYAFSFTLQTYTAIPKNLFLIFCLADLYGCCMADRRAYNGVLLL